MKMLRYGRQTVSVDVDSGVLLFDRKAGSFGVERISHERSKPRLLSRPLLALISSPLLTFVGLQSFRSSSSRARYAW